MYPSGTRMDTRARFGAVPWLVGIQGAGNKREDDASNQAIFTPVWRETITFVSGVLTTIVV